MEDRVAGTMKRLARRKGVTRFAVAGLLMMMGCRTFQNAPGPVPTPADAPPLAAELRTGLPTLLDLGADRCIPCKMMAPVLAELKQEYRDRFQVIFLDVWKNRQPGEYHRIQVIPTQIFFDASGKEVFRHEGFFSKNDILTKWKELNYDLTPLPSGTPPSEK